MNLPDIVFQAVELVPEVKAHLSGKALEILKSIDTYDRQLWKYALDLYRGGDPGVFITSFVEAISNQLRRAWNEGAQEMGVTPKDMTDDDRAEIQAIINAEYEHILDLGTAITAAQSGTIQEFRDTFRPRIDMWVSRYTDVKNQAKIYFGGKTRLMWVEGDTKEKCPTCLALNGIVAFAQEWEMSGVRPQSPPNDILVCGGWNCGCSLETTDKRRSPNALQRIMDIATAANVGKSYNPDQPRVPAGDSEGGQWTSEDIQTETESKPIWAGNKVTYYAGYTLRNGLFNNKDKWIVDDEGNQGPSGDTPQEAIENYENLHKDNEYRIESMRKYDEAVSKIKDGSYQHSDLMIISHGRSDISEHIGIIVARGTGMRDKDAKEIISAVGRIYGHVNSFGNTYIPIDQIALAIQKWYNPSKGE